MLVWREIGQNQLKVALRLVGSIQTPLRCVQEPKQLVGPLGLACLCADEVAQKSLAVCSSQLLFQILAVDFWERAVV